MTQRVHSLHDVHAPRKFKEMRTRANPVVGAMLKGLPWEEIQQFGDVDNEEVFQQLVGEADATNQTTVARGEREKLAVKYSRLSDMFVDGVLDDVVTSVQQIPGISADEKQAIVASFVVEVIKPYEKWLTSSKRRVQRHGLGDLTRSAAYNRRLESLIKQRISEIRTAILTKYEKIRQRLDKRGIFNQETNRLRAGAMLRVELRRRIDIEKIRRDVMKQMEESEEVDAYETPWREKTDPTISRHRNLTVSQRRRSIMPQEPIVTPEPAKRRRPRAVPQVRFATSESSTEEEEEEQIIYVASPKRSLNEDVMIHSDSDKSLRSLESLRSLDRWHSVADVLPKKSMRRWKSVAPSTRPALEHAKSFVSELSETPSDTIADVTPPRPPSDLWGTYGYRPFAGATGSSSPVPSEVEAAEKILDQYDAEELELEEKVETMRARMRDRRAKLMTHPHEERRRSAPDIQAAPSDTGGRHRYVPGHGDVDDLVSEYPPHSEAVDIIEGRKDAPIDNIETGTVDDMRSVSVRIASHSGELPPSLHSGFGLGPLPIPTIPIDTRLAQDLINTPTNVLDGSIAWNSDSLVFRSRGKVKRRQLLTTERMDALYDSLLAGVSMVPLDPVDDDDLQGCVAPREMLVQQLKSSEPTLNITKSDVEDTPATAAFHRFSRSRAAVASLRSNKGIHEYMLSNGLLSGMSLVGTGGQDVVRLAPWTSSAMTRVAHCQPWKSIAPSVAAGPTVTVDDDHGVAIRPMIEWEVSPSKVTRAPSNRSSTPDSTRPPWKHSNSSHSMLGRYVSQRL